jgi:orotate phosphoribosyltransferase
MALSRQGRDVAFAFNRKEAKDHGEGGDIIGAPLQGKVLIIDDVMTAGTAVRESMAVLARFPAQAVGVVLSLDRMEKGTSELSAIQEVQQQYRIPVITIATLDDLLSYLSHTQALTANIEAVSAYRERYGVRLQPG